MSPWSAINRLLSPKHPRIYLDHAAAAPVRKEVARAMQPYIDGVFGNASAIHTEGVIARKVIEDARMSVARTLHVRTTGVTFTSGGTESNNLALRGTVESLRKSDVSSDAIEIIATKTEHPSIAAVLEVLEAEGCTVTYVPVLETGAIDLAAFKSALSPRTRLVTVAYANSETGVTQDLARIGRVIKEHEERTKTNIVFHTDASQAPLWLPCDLERLHVDMMTLDSGKFGGPKGCGVLVHRSNANLTSVTFGGSQERSLRPGTENTPLVVGFAYALVLAQSKWQERSERVRMVRDYGIQQLCSIENVVLNGSKEDRIANNINVSIPGLDTEYAVITLDAKGIACSTKSACSGKGSGRSHVVYEMTGDTDRAASTIRFTLGEETTKKDMDRVVRALQEHIVHVGKSSLAVV